MNKPGEHAEDVEHELEHAGREVGEAFAESIKPASEDEAPLTEDDSADAPS
jgi:hypothetical protein